MEHDEPHLWSWADKTMIKYILLLLMMAGCDLKEKYEDVSANRMSKEIIGSRYEVIGELRAYGIWEYSGQPLHTILLIPPPGIDGNEIGLRVSIRKGTVITVRKVIRTNRVFENKMNLEVDLNGTELPKNLPIVIELFRGNEGDGYLQLNPAIYRKIP